MMYGCYFGVYRVDIDIESNINLLIFMYNTVSSCGWVLGIHKLTYGYELAIACKLCDVWNST